MPGAQVSREVWGHAAPKILKLRGSEMLLPILLKIYISSRKSILEKGHKTSRLWRDYRDFFQVLFATENVHHSLTQDALTPTTALTALRKGQSRFSHTPENLCFPYYSVQLLHALFHKK